LGILWAFLTPLLTTVTWVFLSASGVVQVGETDIPYPVYVFVGTLLWGVLVESINAPLSQVTAEKSTLAKLNFPREALIVAGIYKALFNAAIRVSIVLICLPFLGVTLKLTVILFPLVLLSLILVGTALGLLVTPIGALYSDVGKILPVLMQFAMYISPVVFAMPEQGIARLVFLLNPFSSLLITGRDLLTGSSQEYVFSFLVVNALAVPVLLIGWIGYRVAMPIVIERMSS